MTVWVYINTAKEVGDVDYLKVFAGEDAAERWFAEHENIQYRGDFASWLANTGPVHVER